MPISWSIRHYLVVLVLAMAVPLVALLVYSMQLNYNSALQEAELDVRRQAEVAAADTSRLVVGAADFLRGLAARPQIAALDYQSCDPVLTDLKELFPHYAVIGVLDRSGQMVCASGHPSGTKLPNFSDFEWVQQASKVNDFFVSVMHVGKVSGKWVSTFSAPIRDEQGNYNGLVGYSFDLASNPLLNSSQASLRAGEAVALVDLQGRVVMRSRSSSEEIGAPHSLASFFPSMDAGVPQLLHVGGQERLAIRLPVEGTPWAAVAELPSSAVLDNLWLRANYQYLFAVVLILLGSMLAVFVGSRIVNPITAIAQLASRVAHGDSHGRVSSHGPRELVNVATEINHMLDVRLAVENRYHDLIEAASDGIVVVGEDGTVALTNRRACEIFGYPEGALVGQSLDLLIPENSRKLHNQLIQQYVANPLARDAGRVVRGLRRDGTEISCEITLSPMQTPSGVIVSAFIRDLSEWNRLEAQLAFLARHDSLTGLPNRSLLADRLDMAVARAQRGGGVAVVHIDLDNFAQINDYHGLGVADEVLKGCAEALRYSVREFDTVVRSGSDEFVVLLESEQILPVTEQFVDRVRERFALLTIGDSAQVLRVTASFGIALFPCEGGASELLKNADLALADARQQGGDSFRYFDQRMDASARRRVALLGALHGALERHELAVVYQPQVETATGRIIGVEALLRWYHPELGPVSPLEFIPLMESTGLIDRIGAWVLQTACQQAAAWRDLRLEPLSLAVNLSARQFRDREGLLNHVHQALSSTQIDPSRLELEITESMLMDSPQAAVETLHALRAMGVRISIDDFGTGYSSLSYLRRFPVHALKVDRSFVRDLVHHRDDREIVGAVISLARSLRLDVVAEGVETESQRDFLLSQGCPFCQGFLFSRPVPADEISAMLAS